MPQELTLAKHFMEKKDKPSFWVNRDMHTYQKKRTEMDVYKRRGQRGGGFDPHM